MPATYFDTSALVKLMIEEIGTMEAVGVWQSADLIACSRLAYPEVRAALAAAARNKDLSYDGLRKVEKIWEELWARVRPVELTSQVEMFAGILAREHALRGADSVHLASALTLPHDSLVFACWDRRLHGAAKRLELNVVPRAIADRRKTHRRPHAANSNSNPPTV